ncbi:MAG TPA: hypothetical protein VFW19_02535 [Allosphingosinicella sp.]|nr:hypothetical protein [Allosphingosinicella sp.]
MDDDDYRALIEVVADELTRSGAPDIADENHYSWTDPDTGEAKLFEPRKRLIMMLQAFDRFVAIQDRALLTRSLATIQRGVRSDGPQRVVVALADDDGAREIDLADAPDFADVREGINNVIGRLLEDRFRYPEGEESDES